MKKSFLICFFIIINVFAALYAGAYTISGTIPYGTDVTVSLSGYATAVTVTDSNGYYEFSDLPEGGTYTIKPSKGTKPPQVHITHPSPNNAVLGTVPIDMDMTTDICAYAFQPYQITITSLDNDYTNQDFQLLATSCCDLITNVDTYIGNTLIDTQSTLHIMCHGSYSFSWDTTLFSNGQHIIKVTVTTDSMRTASDEIPVIITNTRTMALCGDVNTDCTIDIVDALLTAQYYVGIQPTVFDTPLGDVNLDNVVDIIDALLIAQYYVGLINGLPEPRDGGFFQISTASVNAIEAYDFLIADIASHQPDITLGAVKLAFSQVVAGINVRLVVSYNSTGAREEKYLAAVLYFDLIGSPPQIRSLDMNLY